MNSQISECNFLAVERELEGSEGEEVREGPLSNREEGPCENKIGGGPILKLAFGSELEGRHQPTAMLGRRDRLFHKKF